MSSVPTWKMSIGEQSALLTSRGPLLVTPRILAPGKQQPPFPVLQLADGCLRAPQQSLPLLTLAPSFCGF